MSQGDHSQPGHDTKRQRIVRPERCRTTDQGEPVTIVVTNETGGTAQPAEAV